jgi:hypothetical protein
VTKIETSHNGNNSVLPCYGTIHVLSDSIKLLSTYVVLKKICFYYQGTILQTDADGRLDECTWLGTWSSWKICSIQDLNVCD